VVHNGTEALQQLNQHRYDLILMDIQMQGMDGFETTRQIRRLERADKNHPHVPIIAMTAYALGGDRERALQSGMDDYISKPFDPEDLKQKLERHLARASAA
jgi:CheY-like chemotaxis protein